MLVGYARVSTQEQDLAQVLSWQAARGREARPFCGLAWREIGIPFLPPLGTLEAVSG